MFAISIGASKKQCTSLGLSSSVRDATFVPLFVRVGLSADQAVTFSLLVVLVLNVVAGLMGLVAWTIHPVSRERSTQQAREAP